MPIDLIALSAAWLSGLFGGLHCLAMCGGLAAGFAAHAPPGQAFGHALRINLGRIAGYAIAGVIVGALGGGLLSLARLPGLALVLRMTVGAVLLVAAIRLLDSRGRLAFLARPGARLWQSLQPLQRRLLPASGALRPWLQGLFWGWLPCGLSTTLLTAAWLEASAWHGGALMLAFGLGTLPTMLSVSWSGARIGRALAQPRWRILAAAWIGAAGVLTMTAPWLATQPFVHGALQALGCRSLLAS